MGECCHGPAMIEGVNLVRHQNEHIAVRLQHALKLLERTAVDSQHAPGCETPAGSRMCHLLCRSSRSHRGCTACRDPSRQGNETYVRARHVTRWSLWRSYSCLSLRHSVDRRNRNVFLLGFRGKHRTGARQSPDRICLAGPVRSGGNSKSFESACGPWQESRHPRSLSSA
jgi:hypothetical protein